MSDDNGQPTIEKMTQEGLSIRKCIASSDSYGSNQSGGGSAKSGGQAQGGAVGVEDEGRVLSVQTLRPPTPGDLHELTLEQAIEMLGESNIHRLCLLCSRQQAGVVEAIAIARDRKMPMVFYVPDEMLKHAASWALVGEHSQILNEPDA